MFIKEAIESLTYHEVVLLSNVLKQGNSQAADCQSISNHSGRFIIRNLKCCPAKDKKVRCRTFCFTTNGHYLTLE